MPNYLPEPVENLGGRPSGLTEDLARRIACEVRMGAKPLRAAALCGVARSTWYGWLERHEQRIQPYASLIGIILLAQDSFEAVTEQRVAEAAEWQAAAWILKTRHRREYGDRVETREPPKAEPQRIGLTKQELIAEAERRGLPTKIFVD